ncbi:MAG TPA: CHRD domain-containing protein, partial [Nitrososphaeraceae archaeon]
MSSGQAFYTVVLIIAVFYAVVIVTEGNSASPEEDQNYVAHLSGDQEVPPNNSTSKGWAFFKPMEDKVEYQVNVSGIDKVTMAHIHGGKARENGDPIAMVQTKLSGSTSGTLALGNITASDLMGLLEGKSISDLVSEMKSGKTYVNIQTEAHPGGEIRGQ